MESIHLRCADASGEQIFDSITVEVDPIRFVVKRISYHFNWPQSAANIHMQASTLSYLRYMQGT